MAEKRTYHLSLWIKPSEFQKLKLKSELLGISQSDYVRLAITEQMAFLSPQLKEVIEAAKLLLLNGGIKLNEPLKKNPKKH